MVSKLVFKGEKGIKKRSSKSKISKEPRFQSSDNLKESKTELSRDATVEVEGVWTTARSSRELVGPIVMAIVSLLLDSDFLC